MFILKSRKFWLAVFGVIQTVDALVVVLIYSIAVEDAGAKAGGAEF
jgi:hypothetical protein